MCGQWWSTRPLWSWNLWNFYICPRRISFLDTYTVPRLMNNMHANIIPHAVHYFRQHEGRVAVIVVIRGKERGETMEGLLVKLKMREGRWSQPLLLPSIFHSCCYPHLSEHYSLKCHNSWPTVTYPGFSIKQAANPLPCFQQRGQIPSSGLRKNCLLCIKV